MRSAMSQMSADGTLEKIFRKHLSAELAQAIYSDYQKHLQTDSDENRKK